MSTVVNHFSDVQHVSVFRVRGKVDVVLEAVFDVVFEVIFYVMFNALLVLPIPY